jgi:hypothetical protein
VAGSERKLLLGDAFFCACVLIIICVAFEKVDMEEIEKVEKREEKKDMIEIKKEAKKLAKESEHKNVDMEEIEKVEKREEKKGVQWECNITGVAQLPGESIDMRLMEIAHQQENDRQLRYLQDSQDPSFYADQYLAQ